ncbi:hypothetical protein [Sphingomonas sp. dw_22]|uniref:hypothetical protein n=1 Tax=Sphingomonas sp. dw_22 TaxID=2721175 RepID=UPI001BD482AB|nr:hypothetical protein [Sphingomonas sp. dw_22]
MAKVLKSQSELTVDFIEAVRLLELACYNFDCVDFSAAKGAANLLHQLVDDRGQNKSHVTRLGVRGSIEIWRLPDITPPSPGFFNALCDVMFGIGRDGNGRQQPRAFNMPPYLHQGHMKLRAQKSSVDEWLDASIIRLASGEWLSRRNIIRYVRDQDAGAHSDLALDALYADFKKSLVLHPGSNIDIEGQVTPVSALLQNPALATVRQIAHEFLSSIYSASNTRTAQPPRCMVYIYGSDGALTKVVRPKGYKPLPINPPLDLLVEV